MPEQTVTPALELSGLSLAYRGTRGPIPALTDVSFAVAPGEFVALVGESGSGKTTITGAVTGLLPRTA